MTTQFTSVHNGRMYVVGRQVVCDICMRMIYDSRQYKPDKLFYAVKMTSKGCKSKFQLCGAKCARKLIDDFLKVSNEEVKEGKISIETTACGDLPDHSTPPEGIPEDVYRKMQKEAY